MGGLRIGFRAGVLATWALCGLSVFCLVSTWLPEDFVAPQWLVLGLFTVAFPITFASAGVAAANGVVAPRGRGGDARLPAYLRLMPQQLLVAHGAMAVLAFVGFISGLATMDDVYADANGYHRVYQDKAARPTRETVVDITEADYRAAARGDLRFFSSGPIAVLAGGSLLLIAAGLADGMRSRRLPD